MVGTGHAVQLHQPQPCRRCQQHQAHSEAALSLQMLVAALQSSPTGRCPWGCLTTLRQSWCPPRSAPCAVSQGTWGGCALSVLRHTGALQVGPLLGAAVQQVSVYSCPMCAHDTRG